MRLTLGYRACGAHRGPGRPLSPEDQTVQSMPDVSPTKWHRAHTSWFFETFLLEPELPGYRPSTPPTPTCSTPTTRRSAPGTRGPAGAVSRPGIAEVAEYRRHVDEAMDRLLAGALVAGHLGPRRARPAP